MLPSDSFGKISSPQRQISDVRCLVFFGLFAKALYRIYCLPYSRNSSKLLESSAFGLIDLGLSNKYNVVSRRGCAYRKISLYIIKGGKRELRRNRVWRKNAGRKARWAGFLNCMENTPIFEIRVIVELHQLA